MKRNIDSVTLEELSKLIVDAIGEERFFNKDVLIPKVRSIIRGFARQLNSANFNKIANPSKDAQRLRVIESERIAVAFWKEKVRELDKANIQKYYRELDELMAKNGFTERTDKKLNPTL